jgi:hypothetical protein
MKLDNQDDETRTLPSPEALRREAAALNHILGEIGLTSDEQVTWWNVVAQADLGNRTATQAWLAGDVEGVTALVKGWYAKSRSAADQASHSPEFLGTLRAKLADLEKWPYGDSPVHQTA